MLQPSVVQGEADAPDNVERLLEDEVKERAVAALEVEPEVRDVDTEEADDVPQEARGVDLQDSRIARQLRDAVRRAARRRPGAGRPGPARPLRCRVSRGRRRCRVGGMRCRSPRQPSGTPRPRWQPGGVEDSLRGQGALRGNEDEGAGGFWLNLALSVRVGDILRPASAGPHAVPDVCWQTPGVCFGPGSLVCR